MRPGLTVREDGNDPQWQAWYDAVQRLRSFHAFPHQPRLLAALRAMLGAEVLVHPRNIARAVGPGTARFTTPPHQDHWYIGGTPDVWTAWVPVGDCPDEFGGLAVLPGSHKAGLLPRRPAEGAGGSGVDADLGATWAWEPLAAGDALLFHSLTVHQARDHRSQRLRLSLDMRFQRVADPVRSDSLEPHYGRQTWEELSAGWPAGDPLRRYWERLPLTVV
ncbi:MAG: phytanoyl-CoA dioxygenase family protein [Minicystis sp.]